MTSNLAPSYSEAYVWFWLPDAEAPVVAGMLSRQGRQFVFNYGRSYLGLKNAIPLYAPELPLQTGLLPLLTGLDMPSCLRDASPDAWGRRVLMNRKFGMGDRVNDELDELTYLLESGSNRIGALDFQTSSSKYFSRQVVQPSIEDLLTAADRVDRGLPLVAELDQALLHGTSLGGARPKVLIEDEGHQYIAKFSASNDLYNVVRAEFIAMRLAFKVGLKVAPVKLQSVLGKDVLLIERFDRVRTERTWQRCAMVSALTILELDEMMAAYASYETLAEIVRHRFVEPKQTLRELFSRLVFNVLCGNTDDHARNHAAFWNGSSLALTPAYDICPQSRTGQQASQAMLIRGRDRSSQIATCVDAAGVFLLGRQDAIQIVNQQIDVIVREWDQTCDEAHLSPVERHFFWRRQFLNPYVMMNAPEGVRVLSGKDE